MLTRSAKRRKIAEDEAATPQETGDKSSALVTRFINGCNSLKAAVATDDTAKRNLTLNYMLSNLLVSFTEYFDAGTDLVGNWADAASTIVVQMQQEGPHPELPEDRNDNQAVTEWVSHVPAAHDSCPWRH